MDPFQSKPIGRVVDYTVNLLSAQPVPRIVCEQGVFWRV